MLTNFTYLIEDRRFRHLLFWMAWVLSFTFIKSIGESFSVYFSWFAYYTITLPIFAVHTYLVAYYLVPVYFNRRLLPVFVFLFILIFYGFSMLEMWISTRFIFSWFSLLPATGESFLDPVDVMRSGVGNLYIVLVFLAVKNLWDWSGATLRERVLQQSALKVQMEETMTRVQPMMLMYAIEHIDRMVEEQRPDISRAIALTSELLSEVMMFHEEGARWMSREIVLVRKLIRLNGILRGRKPEVEFFISGDTGDMQLPPMILFSCVDLILRNLASSGIEPEIHIEVLGFSNMLSLEVLYDLQGGKDQRYMDCMNALSQMGLNYDGQVKISTERHPYGCSAIIKATHHEKSAEDPLETRKA